MDDMQTVLVPTGARSAATLKMAERPKSLAGMRIGLLDNGKEFSDVVLAELAETLRLDHHAIHIKFWRKGFPAKVAPFIEEMAAETDVAVSGSGTAARRRRGASSMPLTSKRLAFPRSR
jgi:hypothetical protein